jgi:hypothetical protein
VASAQIGDRLTDAAIETARTERHGIYDVVATSDSGAGIAEIQNG